MACAFHHQHPCPVDGGAQSGRQTGAARADHHHIEAGIFWQGSDNEVDLMDQDDDGNYVRTARRRAGFADGNIVNIIYTKRLYIIP